MLADSWGVIFSEQLLADTGGHPTGRGGESTVASRSPGEVLTMLGEYQTMLNGDDRDAQLLAEYRGQSGYSYCDTLPVHAVVSSSVISAPSIPMSSLVIISTACSMPLRSISPIE